MSQITVVKAIYGMSGASIDVTDYCQAQVDNNYANFITVNNEVFGNDPDPGNRKSFAIIFYNAAASGSAMRAASVYLLSTASATNLYTGHLTHRLGKRDTREKRRLLSNRLGMTCSRHWV